MRQHMFPILVFLWEQVLHREHRLTLLLIKDSRHALRHECTDGPEPGGFKLIALDGGTPIRRDPKLRQCAFDAKAFRPCRNKPNVRGYATGEPLKLQVVGGAHQSTSAHKFLYGGVRASRRGGSLLIVSGSLQTISISLTRFRLTFKPLDASVAAKTKVFRRLPDLSDCKSHGSPRPKDTT